MAGRVCRPLLEVADIKAREADRTRELLTLTLTVVE